jgi:hypothetical protein
MSDRIKVAFTGCSFTRGDGFAMAYLAPEIWPNIISRVFNFEPHNLAISGASNQRVFQTASQAIRSRQYEIVFCQWTVLHRMWLCPGPDTWYFLTGDGHDSFEYRDIKLNTREKNDLERMIKLLNHDYQNIMDLVDHVNLLEDLAAYHKVKLIHVNGMVPWQADIADATVAQDFSRMSTYTREILDFDNRDDAQIQQLFVKLHTKFATMNTRNWVNLFRSFSDQCVDVGPQGHHPGTRSHVIMSNQVRSFLHKGIL